MPLKIGRYAIFIKKNLANPINLSPDIPRIEDGLDEFGKHFGELSQKIRVNGSAGLYLNFGSWVRQINDIDVDISRDDLSDIVKHLQNKDYKLGNKIAMAKISAKTDKSYLFLYRIIDFPEDIPENLKIPRFILMDNKIKVSELTQIIDIWLQQNDSKSIISTNGKKIICIEPWEILTRYITKSGNPIYSPEIKYILRVKKLYEGPSGETNFDLKYFMNLTKNT